MKYVGSMFLVLALLTATDAHAQTDLQRDTTALTSGRGDESDIPRRVVRFTPANVMSTAHDDEAIAMTVGASAGAVLGYLAVGIIRELQGTNADAGGRFAGAIFGAAFGAVFGLVIVSTGTE